MRWSLNPSRRKKKKVGEGTKRKNDSSGKKRLNYLAKVCELWEAEEKKKKAMCTNLKSSGGNDGMGAHTTRILPCMISCPMYPL